MNKNPNNLPLATIVVLFLGAFLQVFSITNALAQDGGESATSAANNASIQQARKGTGSLT